MENPDQALFDWLKSLNYDEEEINKIITEMQPEAIIKIAVTCQVLTEEQAAAINLNYSDSRSGRLGNFLDILAAIRKEHSDFKKLSVFILSDTPQPKGIDQYKQLLLGLKEVSERIQPAPPIIEQKEEQEEVCYASDESAVSELVQNLQEERERLENLSKQKQFEVEKKNDELDEMYHAISNSEERTKSLEKELKKKKISACSTAEAKIKGLIEDNSKILGELQSKEQKVTKILSELNKLKKDLEEAKQVEQQAESKCANIEYKNAKLSTKLEETLALLKQVTTENEELKRKLKLKNTLQGDSNLEDSVQEKLAVVTEELVQYKEKVDALTSENELLKGNVEDDKKEKEALQNERDKYKQEWKTEREKYGQFFMDFIAIMTIVFFYVAVVIHYI